MPRSEKSQPSQPLVQLRLASMRADLDARRLPGESYSHTVRWILSQYLDMMHELDDDGSWKGRDSWYDADLERRDAVWYGANRHNAAD